MNREELLNKKGELEEQLKNADESNNLVLCINLGEQLNEIDKILNKLSAEEVN